MPIVQAIFEGNVIQLTELISQKEEVNATDQDKRTPMHAAAYVGDAECIRALIQAGGKTVVKDANWLTPLHYAAARGHDVRLITLGYI
jgi:serine/threonine-protein phosphatase 6 regulatory ankyrin repeat subunit A